MKCECKDENGDLFYRCLGTCSTAKIIIKHQEERNILAERIDHLVPRIVSSIENILPRIKEELSHQWKSGFLDGIKFAMENDLTTRDY